MRPSQEVIILANWDEIYGQSSRKLGDGDGHQCLARPPRMEQLSSSSSSTLYLIIITLSHFFRPSVLIFCHQRFNRLCRHQTPCSAHIDGQIVISSCSCCPSKGGMGWGHYYPVVKFFVLIVFIKHTCWGLLFHCIK